jgi:hypothetical protein
MIMTIKEKHFKAGNAKISKDCLISCLPTEICFGCNKQCAGCYAKKAEIRFPNALQSRRRKLAQTKSDNFVADAVAEIRKSNKKYVRIHESGDFYDQAYIEKYVDIVKALPDVKFYAYTKKDKKLNFSALLKLDNFNLIVSNTPMGLNYGDMDYCKKLVKDHGYKLCPCGIDKTVVCMGDCKYCADHDKVCFLKH